MVEYASYLISIFMNNNWEKNSRQIKGSTYKITNLSADNWHTVLKLEATQYWDIVL